MAGKKKTADVAEQVKAPEAPSFKLVRIPEGLFRDIYGDPTKLVSRMSWVNAQVVHVLKKIEEEFKGEIVISDFYRKPTESYIARIKKGSMVAPCGLSGHNYGLSMDVAVDTTLKRISMSYSQMVAAFKKLGLNGIKKESWHFNLMFIEASDYFYGLYNQFSDGFKKHISTHMVSQFSTYVQPVKNIKEIQTILGLTVDGIPGRQTVMSVSMLLAEKKGLLPVDDVKLKEITVNFTDIWV